MIDNSLRYTADFSKAVLVALATSAEALRHAEEYLDELEFLAKTAGITTAKKYLQKLPKPDSRTFIGKGKLAEIKTYITAENIGVVIFDDDLTPSQLKNIEKELLCKIYDRSLLILEIFLLRAKTNQSKTQVELARYQYLLPRLTRMWTHLERQRGGTSTRGGAGEKEIETDRRVIKNKITLLKQKLTDIEKQNITRRKARSNIVRVALVGYTNVGKSTLMNILSKANVFAEDKLFATVDSTVRKVYMNNISFLLSDTVGFIRKLPHSLIESFKSTLDEVREAHILLHVVDVSHPAFEEQMDVVKKTLVEIHAADKTVITVFNKIDKYIHTGTNTYFNSLQEKMLHLQSSYLSKSAELCVFISAAHKFNIEELKSKLFQAVYNEHIQIYPNYLQKDVQF
ncbi:MAG: GTPase HflX [Cytophagaceae bacterium]|nr:GTPase HflX [Cytophagaceae bacterium]MDW8455408.1 GTPase HflX [Cytophagaceae bacterium]